VRARRHLHVLLLHVLLVLLPAVVVIGVIVVWLEQMSGQLVIVHECKRWLIHVVAEAYCRRHGNGGAGSRSFRTIPLELRRTIVDVELRRTIVDCPLLLASGGGSAGHRRPSLVNLALSHWSTWSRRVKENPSVGH
jgi:hypothetical protein